jgi:hypothetical protein
MRPLFSDTLKVLSRIITVVFFFVLLASCIVIESMPVHVRSSHAAKGVR